MDNDDKMAVLLHPALYRDAEKAGVDMRNFRMLEPVPSLAIPSLEERVERLEAAILPDERYAIPRHWGLTYGQAQVLRALLLEEFVVKDRNMPRVGSNSLPVMLVRIRQRLAKLKIPILIQSRRGVGYFIDAETRKAFRAGKFG